MQYLQKVFVPVCWLVGCEATHFGKQVYTSTSEKSSTLPLRLSAKIAFTRLGHYFLEIRCMRFFETVGTSLKVPIVTSDSTVNVTDNSDGSHSDVLSLGNIIIKVASKHT